MQTNKHHLLMRGVIFGIVAALIWGAFPVFTRFSMENQLTAYDIVALRFMVAGPILIFVLYKTGLCGVPVSAIVLMVCGAGVLYLLLVNIGLIYAPASHFGAITPSTMLIFSTLGSYLWLGDKLNKSRISGVVIIVCGLILISWDGLNTPFGNAWIGDVLFVFGGLLWAAYTIATRYWKVDPLQAIAIVSVFSMLIYLPPYFFFAGSHLLEVPVFDVIFQAIFQGILSVLVALLLYTKAVAILGAAKAAVFAALVPGISVIFAIPILNEIPGPIQLLGIILVTGGMLLALNFINFSVMLKRCFTMGRIPPKA